MVDERETLYLIRFRRHCSVAGPRRFWFIQDSDKMIESGLRLGWGFQWTVNSYNSYNLYKIGWTFNIIPFWGNKSHFIIGRFRVSSLKKFFCLKKNSSFRIKTLPVCRSRLQSSKKRRIFWWNFPEKKLFL